jgi:hypothetical protein
MPSPRATPRSPRSRRRRLKARRLVEDIVLLRWRRSGRRLWLGRRRRSRGGRGRLTAALSPGVGSGLRHRRRCDRRSRRCRARFVVGAYRRARRPPCRILARRAGLVWRGPRLAQTSTLAPSRDVCRRYRGRRRRLARPRCARLARLRSARKPRKIAGQCRSAFTAVGVVLAQKAREAARKLAAAEPLRALVTARAGTIAGEELGWRLGAEILAPRGALRWGRLVLRQGIRRRP